MLRGLTGKQISLLDAFDQDGRDEISREISRFRFENASTIPTASVFRGWPVGLDIDEWEMVCCVARLPSNLEFVPSPGQLARRGGGI